jgi:uncharacterized delta-60 repeat protein
MSCLACEATDDHYSIVQRSVSARRVVVSSVAATVLAGLILWPAAASGGHSSSSAAVPLLAGDLDWSFGSAGVVTLNGGLIHALAVQPDGKIVVAGQSFDSSFFRLVRYLSDGSPDSSFGDGGSVETQVGEGGCLCIGGAQGVALQPDGKIVLAGASDQGGVAYPGSLGINSEFSLLRYDSNGSLDSSFGTNGVTNTVIPGQPDELWAAEEGPLAILPGGQILAGGQSFSYPGGSAVGIDGPAYALAEYTSDGSLDSAFGKGGIVQTTFAGGAGAGPASVGVASLALQADGKIVASGTDSGPPQEAATMKLARYEPDGSLDSSFGKAGRVQTAPTLKYVDGPSVLQDGKIVVAGERVNSTYGWPRFPVVARFGAHGRLDPTFGHHGYEEIRSLKGEAAEAVVTQPDGKILVVSSRGFGSRQTVSAVVRLTPNGRLDPSFGHRGIETLPDGIEASVLALQADGNILVGGNILFSGDYAYAFTLVRLIGGNNCYVPALRGKTISQARGNLKASYCLTGGISTLYSNRIPRGRVISTTPLPGDRLPAGTTIDLLVSRGKRPHHS